ncbi:Gfo/Idh/MocA family protein [Microbacterium sp. NPDC055665]
MLAPGGIARDFVAALHTHTDQRVHAVASRDPRRARSFAAEHGIARAYETYEALVADSTVDIVYISAPHSEHHRLAHLAIAAQKHVLVEKPMATSAVRAQSIADAARRAGVFAMEAMWSRFLPQTTIIERLLAEGELGENRLVTADYGSLADYDPTHRLFDPSLGGGALLDVGVYPVWFAQFVLGAPAGVAARGALAGTGVDSQASLLLDTAQGAQALLSTSLLCRSPKEARIHGSRASLQIDTPFFAPGGFTLTRADGTTQRWRDETGLRHRAGLAWQAAAVAHHIGEGRTESPWHPLSDSVTMLRTIDEARRQIGAR